MGMWEDVGDEDNMVIYGVNDFKRALVDREGCRG